MGQVFNSWLRDLGFESYAAYLNSALWAGIRSRVFAAKGRKCLRCGSKAQQVHHAQYSPAIMRGEDIEPLDPICGMCHSKEHEGQHKPVRRVRKKQDGTIVIPWDGKGRSRGCRSKSKGSKPTGKLPRGKKRKRPTFDVTNVHEVCPVCHRSQNVKHFENPGGICKKCANIAKAAAFYEATLGTCSQCGKKRAFRSLARHPATGQPACVRCRDAHQEQQRRERIRSTLAIMRERPESTSAMLKAYNERRTSLGAALNRSREQTEQPSANIELRGVDRHGVAPKAKAQDTQPISEIAAGQACGTVRQPQRPVVKAQAE